MKVKFGMIQIGRSREESQISEPKMFYIEMGIVILLMTAFLINLPALVLLVFVAACILVMSASYRKSIYYLAFFTSFAGIFVYQGRHMYFVMAAFFIIKSFCANKVQKTTLMYYLGITIYCLAFSDVNGEFTFAKTIGVLLLFVIPLIADYSDKIDCTEFMRHYILGFTIATIIGFFVMDIPSMRALFSYDLMWTAEFQELTRFFGLSFDSNFYALSNYIVIAYLLFSFDQVTRLRGALIVFFILAGLQTVSKSYFLTLGLLLVCYFVKNIAHYKKIVLALIVGVAGIWCFIFLSNRIGYNVIKLIIDRFVVGGSLADNTTGRAEIWSNYFDMFEHAGIKEVLFGFGFNATVEKAAHNTFIELIFHFGFIGLLLWIMYFAYCAKNFFYNTWESERKSPMVLLCLLLGVFFLSAYTYEAFWIGLVIAFMNLGTSNRNGGSLVDV